MRAITVVPLQKGSLELTDMPEPPGEDGPVLVETVAIGICATDLEIINGDYGWAPPGESRLTLGHESLGRVLEAPARSGLAVGDLVVGIVRRPDPVPCPNCAAGEWDMCRNGQYTERGIKERHGFASERYRTHAEHVTKVHPTLGDLGVLLEPATIVAKAWDHIEKIGRRAVWEPAKVLVTGAGPVGLLAALLSVQRGLETHVLDQVTGGLKPQLVADLGATYHTGDLEDAAAGADVVVECTGVAQVALAALCHNAPDGIVCLTGVSSGGRDFDVDAGELNRKMVLQNDVVLGSVNANRHHYQVGADALAKADRTWLARLVTRRVPVGQWQEAYVRQPGDVKTTLDFTR